MRRRGAASARVERHRCGGALLCAGECLDQRRRLLRPRRAARSRRITSTPRGEQWVDVPAGSGATWTSCTASSAASKQSSVQVNAGGADRRLAVNLDEGSWSCPGLRAHWVSADVHVHMNYGGDYRNTPAHLVLQAQAENLSIVNSLLVNKEQRFPDIAYNGRQRDPASTPDTLVVHGQEYHTSYWGHLGLLDISGRRHLAGVCRLSEHRRVQPVSDECGCGGHRARSRRPGGLRASLR